MDEVRVNSMILSSVVQSCPTLCNPMNRSMPGLPAAAAASAAKSLQSCPTLCDPRDGSPPGSPIPGILQARILEWVAFAFSKQRATAMQVLQHSQEMAELELKPDHWI